MSDPRYRTARWQKLRKRIIARDGGRCAVPDCTTDMSAKRMTQVDHIIEVKDGGAFWDPSNLRVVCKPHHDAKTLTVLADRPGKAQIARGGGRFAPDGHWRDTEYGREPASPNDVMGCDNPACRWCIAEGFHTEEAHQ